MAKVLYTAYAHVTGGRDGHGRTTDGELEVDLRIPKEMGGAGGGTNPEDLFAVGYAACFESALGAVARRDHLDAGEVTIDSAVSLLPSGDGGFKLAAAPVAGRTRRICSRSGTQRVSKAPSAPSLAAITWMPARSRSTPR